MITIPESFSYELLAAASSSAGQRFVQRRVARFQDVDAAGIVFFAKVFEYFHDAYFAMIEQAGVHLPDVLGARAWAAPLRRAEAEFLRPIRFGDELDVTLLCARINGSELLLGWRIDGVTSGKPLAVGRTLHVFLDGTTLRRVDVPPPLRAAFERLGS